MTRTKLSLALALFAVAALLPAGLVQADFTILDSSAFAYGYEANSALPTVEDTATGWTKIGTAGYYTVDVPNNNLDYSTMPDASGGQWFATTAGGGWGATITPETSYTVEFSAKVTEGVGAVPGLQTIFDNNSEKIWLNVAPDHTAIGPGNMETTVLSTAANDTEFHTFRLGFDASTDKFHVWRDGLSIGNNLAATTVKAAVSMSFGDATSQGSGAGSLDYFRWDPTGIYAPTPPAPEPLLPKDSADFAHKYEANSSLPTVEDSGAGKTNWQHLNFYGTAEIVDGGGALAYSTSGQVGSGNWFQSTSAVAGSAWAAEVATGTSYSVEFSAKVTAGIGTIPGMHVVLDNGAYRTWFNIDTDHVAIGDGDTEVEVLVDEIDNADDFHVYRISYDAITNAFQVWRDGDQIGTDITPHGTSNPKGIAFGDATSTGSADAVVDYFRWDASGAYTPVPEPGVFTLLGLGALGLLLLRRK